MVTIPSLSRMKLLGLIATAFVMTAPVYAQPPAGQSVDAATKARVSASYGKLPLSFEMNRGQSDKRVKFIARGQGYGLFLTPTEAVLNLRASAREESAAAAQISRPGSRARSDKQTHVVRIRFEGSNKRPQLAGLEPLPGRSNYFIGDDPKRWQRDVTNYARVKYSSVYPGIDLVYYGNQRQLEYDFVVAPGADPRRIKLAFDGVEKLDLDSEGNLVLSTPRGNIVQYKPVIYQTLDGTRKAVDGRYKLLAENQLGFQVAHYDKTQPLIIDPVLAYSSFLGGSGNDIGHGIAVDSEGNAYVAGETTSDTVGSSDAFVAKINAAGTALVYITYLGGSNFDFGYAIAVDSAGSAYVTGQTDSGTPTPTSIPFPTAGAVQPAYKGGGDAFVTKLDVTGSALVYSTFLGGGGNERGYGIAVDSAGSAYVTGHTSSDNVSGGPTGGFPTVAPLQLDNSGPGVHDVFITKFSPTGEFVYSTYLGGTDNEFGDGGIAVDSAGNAYITGTTRSIDFPTAAPLQAVRGGGFNDAFVSKINAAGSALIYSTYLGGSLREEGRGIAVDGAGSAYVTGYTSSNDFPTAVPLQPAKAGTVSESDNDAFVAKINGAGSALVYSTYLGGSGGDIGHAIAVDVAGDAYLTGMTNSIDFPSVAPLQPNAGSGDAFVARVNSGGSALLFSSHLGAQPGSEIGLGIALDTAGNVYVTGLTGSTSFPTVMPFQSEFGGTIGTDAFVSKISFLPKGDANGDGAVTASDIFYMINNLFAGGPASVGPGDANGDGTLSASDIFYLINFLFAGGPAPV